MLASTSTTTIIYGLPFFPSRKLLLHNPLYNSPPLANAPSSPSAEPNVRDNNTFDANVVMVLSVLLCALICSLGLNSIIRCALRCSSFVSSDPNGTGPSTAGLGNTGVKKKALKTFPTMSYSSDLKIATECAICLSEFGSGERVRVLPKCNHGFHVRCIDKWLNSHSSCPTCRHCLIESTCQKIAKSTVASTSVAVPIAPPPPHQIVVRIEPLQPEGLICNHEN